MPLLWVRGIEIDEDLADRLRNCFDMSAVRSLDEDPVMGMRILGEIADRALSPGVNDPGTAIDIVSTTVAVYNNARIRAGNIDEIQPDDRIRVAPVTGEEMIGAVFDPIARDGAAMVEVAEAVQTGLRMLYPILPAGYGKAVRDKARQAFDYASDSLKYEWEVERVREAAGFLLDEDVNDDPSAEIAAQSLHFSRFRPGGQ